jgi:chemotaxis protein methyltransferase CheR
MREDVFIKFKEHIYSEMGITFSPAKKYFLKSKIDKLMKRHEIEDYNEYYKKILNKEKNIYEEFVHEITTHKTDFFREDNHFKFLKEEIINILKINPRILKHHQIRIWSAGCSTGEEPYTIAMVFKEILPENIELKILATDISVEVLKKAVSGSYSNQITQLIPPLFLQKYFFKSSFNYIAKEDLKKHITFRIFNLMELFPFKHNFDIIFCRNVMIYFDNDSRNKLVNKFYNNLIKGGFIIVGHSESLSDSRNLFKFVKPTIYLKE